MDRAMRRMGVVRTIAMDDTKGFNYALANKEERCLCIAGDWGVYNTYRSLVAMHHNMLLLVNIDNVHAARSIVVRSISNEGGVLWYLSQRHVVFSRHPLRHAVAWSYPKSSVVPMFVHTHGVDGMIHAQHAFGALSQLFHNTTSSVLQPVILVDATTDMADIERLMNESTEACARICWHKHATSEHPRRGWFFEWHAHADGFPPSLLAEVYLAHVDDYDITSVEVADGMPRMRRLDAESGGDIVSSTVCVVTCARSALDA